MATRTGTPNGDQGTTARGFVWTGLLNGDQGNAFECWQYSDISIQVLGTFGAGGTLTFEGSNEATPTNWHALNDPQGNSLAVTAAKIEQLLEVVRWVRPNVTAGDGTTTLTVNLFARRTL